MESEQEIEDTIDDQHRVMNVDYESFADTANISDSFEKRQTGFATLKSCDVKKGNEGVLSEVIEVDTDRQAYVFEAELGTGETVKVVCSTNRDSSDNTALRYWCDASSISQIAMEKVPVYRIQNDIYRVDGFEKGVLGVLPFSVLSRILDTNLMRFKDGRWKETYSGSIILTTSVMMFFIIPTLIGMHLYPPISAIYIIVAILTVMYTKRECMLSDHGFRR